MRADRGATGPPPPAGPSGVYVHLPFCRRRCSFCDFAIDVSGRDPGRYINALRREIDTGQRDLPGPVDTVYLGGGTPSLLGPEHLEAVLEAIDARFPRGDVREATLEANPEDVTADAVATWRSLGLDRVSLGVQSLDDAVLRAVGRLHDREASLGAVEQLQTTGFRLSVDVIAGLPHETDEGFVQGLETLLAREPEHVSLYLLEVEKQTPLAAAVAAGRVDVADGTTLERRFTRAAELLEAAGLRRYEIASFARPGAESRHNSKYWLDIDYAGFGMGAHGYIRGQRRGNVGALEPYVEAVEAGRDPAESVEPWDPATRLAEATMCALRRVDGLSIAAFRRRFGDDVGERFAAAWSDAGTAGLVERDGDRIRLTDAGRLRADRVFAELF